MQKISAQATTGSWGKMGADGGLKDVTATYLIDWVIDHHKGRRGAEEGRGSDCNEGPGGGAEG